MRSEDELLDIIHGRASELRAARRRRIGLVTTLSVSVVFALFATVVLAPNGRRADRLDVTGEPITQPSLEGRWIPTAYSAAILHPVGVYLEFISDGSLSGFDGCNSFGARWTVDGDRLQVTGLQAHKVACPPDRDTRLIRILEDSPTIDTFDGVPGTLELSSESGFVAFNPEKPAKPESLDTSTTAITVGPPATTAVPPPLTVAPPTTADLTPPCPSDAVSLAVTLDRATYQPGDVVHITVTLSNSSNTSCWVANSEGPPDVAHECEPDAGLQHGFEGDETEPQYNAALAPFRSARACGYREVVPAGGAVTAMIDAPFETNSPNDDRYFLRAGTWTVSANWGYMVYGGSTATFECPEPGCRKGSFEDPPPQ